MALLFKAYVIDKIENKNIDWRNNRIFKNFSGWINEVFRNFLDPEAKTKFGPFRIQGLQKVLVSATASKSLIDRLFLAS